MRRLLRALLVAAMALVACGPSEDRVIVAAGTTVVDSGILDELVLRYEDREPDVELSVVADATAAILELGRRGGADVLIVHAPELEAAFVAEGRAAVYEELFTSRFVLAGPPDAPDDLDGLGPVEALDLIAARGLPFVSRADGSGTHERELELWAEAGIDPRDRDWYEETGQGMGLTLQVSDQRRAYTLAELGAFLSASDTLSLEELPLLGDARLTNPYHVIVVEDAPPAAMEFVAWLLDPVGQAEIVAVNQELFGTLIYAPVGP